MSFNYECFEKAFAELSNVQTTFLDEQLAGLNEEQMANYFANSDNLVFEISKKWNETENDIFNGKKPIDVYANIGQDELKDFLKAYFYSDAIGIFELYSDIINVNKEVTFKVARPILEEFFSALDDEDTAEKFDYSKFEAAMEIVNLGYQLGYDEFIQDILAAFENLTCDEEVWKAEMFMDMLFMYGEKTLPYLKEKLKDKIAFSYAEGYLIAVIAKVGGNAETKDNELYNILRTHFKCTQSKGYSALCIGDFGDARGIVLLRTWLENNISTMEEQDVWDILASIHKLGGDISDFVDQE